MRKLLLWSLVALFPLPLVFTLNLQLGDAGPVRLYVSLGLVAYSWWLLAILLSVRPSWLDRGVGLPSVYALHGALGVLAVAAAYLHRENTFAVDRLVRDLGDWAFWLAFGVLCYSVLFMSGWLTDRSRLLHAVKAAVGRVAPHQVAIWLHRVNLVVVVLICLHVHLISRINQHLAFMVLFDAYTVVVLSVYAWKKWIAPDAFLTGTVRENTALNGSTRKLTVTLDRRAASARPGDFYFLRFEAPGISREWHPFSATDDGQDALTFTIRQIGDFTGGLGTVSPGTRVRLEGPFGRFDSTIAERPADRPLVFLGMGAGVAPLLSLTAAHHPDRRIRLLWSVHRPDDAYYSTLLHDYERRSAGRLSVTTQVGRFRHDELAELLTPEEVAHGQYFVVGPNPAVLAGQRMLRRIGVSGRRIHHERLTM